VFFLDIFVWGGVPKENGFTSWIPNCCDCLIGLSIYSDLCSSGILNLISMVTLMGGRCGVFLLRNGLEWLTNEWCVYGCYWLLSVNGSWVGSGCGLEELWYLVNSDSYF
jgi:hypothetical protein